MKGKIGRFFISICLISLFSGVAFSETPPPMAVPESPGLPPVNEINTGKKTQRWRVSATYSLYILPGGGLSRYLDQALGVGGELSWRLANLPRDGDKIPWKSHIRLLGDFSYFQMTPGPTLSPSLTSSSSTNIFNPISPTPTGSIPNSASITGFILRAGIAWDIPEITPIQWGLRRVIVPYVRVDFGGVDWAVSNVPGLSGHPFGSLLDAGAGLSLSIPGFPMGVFGEMDPTMIDASGNIMTIVPIVAGITLRF